MTDPELTGSADEAAASQVPPAGSLTLDHLSHFVPDMGEASAALQALGFTLTPFSAQSHRLNGDGPLVPAGTGNRCIMLERGYLEFLTPTGATPVADQLRAALRRYIGIHLVAFGTAAPQADHARLEQNGFYPLAPVALQRAINTMTGEQTARFTVVRVPPGSMAEGRIQYCHQLTPELLWQPRWVSHLNGATGLSAVFLCVSDPAEAAHRYSRFSGLNATAGATSWRIDTQRGALVFADAERFARRFGVSPPSMPWIGGYTLDCDDVSHTREYLCGANIEVREFDGRLITTLPQTLGGFVIWQPRGSKPLEL